MTALNSNASGVLLTNEQYVNVLQFSYFVKSLCYFVNDSAIAIDATAITLMLFSAAADLDKVLGVTVADS